MNWIRICMDPELLRGTEFVIGKFHIWIQSQNKAFHIHNAARTVIKC